MENSKRVIFSMITFGLATFCTILFLGYAEKAAAYDILKAKRKCESLAKKLNTNFIYDKDFGCALQNYSIIKF